MARGGEKKGHKGRNPATAAQKGQVVVEEREMEVEYVPRVVDVESEEIDI